MPNASHDGFFGYVTQAAVRLFQEYVRTRDPDYDPGKGISYPDGIVGPTTWKNIARWEKLWEEETKDKKTHKAKQADWANLPKEKEEAVLAKTWRDRFKKTVKHLKKNPGALEAANRRFKGKTDSLLPEDWKFPKDQPLLFGIRRFANEDNHEIVEVKKNNKIKKEKRRPVDDLFVLLVNGHSFIFYGSTDSSVHMAKKEQEAYLINGQHLYQFSWHMLSSSSKTYRAFRPAEHGVMIIRDTSGADALTEENIKAGPDQSANTTINIHWSGLGLSNWSAGCQVIAGSSYLDSSESLQKCNSFAAKKTSLLGTSTKPKGGLRTKGAYNMLMDLILVYGRNSRWSPCLPLRYTLFSADDMVAAEAISYQKIAGLRKKLK
nr:hypothetical protein [Neolewinella persica]